MCGHAAFNNLKSSYRQFRRIPGFPQEVGLEGSTFRSFRDLIRMQCFKQSICWEFGSSTFWKKKKTATNGCSFNDVFFWILKRTFWAKKMKKRDFARHVGSRCPVGQKKRNFFKDILQLGFSCSTQQKKRKVSVLIWASELKQLDFSCKMGKKGESQKTTNVPKQPCKQRQDGFRATLFTEFKKSRKEAVKQRSGEGRTDENGLLVKQLLFPVTLQNSLFSSQQMLLTLLSFLASENKVASSNCYISTYLFCWQKSYACPIFSFIWLVFSLLSLFPKKVVV